MARMIAHAEAEQLLGALALDAVEADERESLELHLETCPKCRDELRNHLEVVGLLAYAGQAAPPGLWDRIVSGLSDEASDGTADPGRPVDAFILPRRVDAATGSPFQRRPTSGARAARSTPRVARSLRLASLAAAACIMVILGIAVVHLEGRVNNLSGQLSAAGNQATIAQVDSALSVPGARKVVLDSPGGRPALDAVILPGGEGYLYSITLAPLPRDKTYQLWGVTGAVTISYGLIGASPQQVVPFRAATGVIALAVTAEVAGGVDQSTNAPVAVGELR